MLSLGLGACSDLPAPLAAPEPMNSRASPRTEPNASDHSDRFSIADIQGAAHVSPLFGLDVENLEGVVTYVEPRGFYLQAVTADHDERTSEGVFVALGSYDRRARDVGVGDLVQVSGNVAEHRGRCEGCQVNERELAQTELDASLVQLVGRSALPAEIVLGPEGIRVGSWVEDDADGDVERNGVRFDPEADALDAYESLEGMRVLVQRPRVVAPSRSGTEFTLVPDGDAGALSVHLGLLAASGPNPQRLCVRVGAEVELNVGDRFQDDVVGVLSGHGPCLLVDDVPAVEAAAAPSALDWPPPRSNELTLGALNAHNLSRDVEPERIAQLVSTIVNALPALDLLLLTEIQDDSGGRDDGVVSAEQTLEWLTTELAQAGAPSYDWIQINPVDGRDGGQPGANIRQVFLFDTSRGLSFASESSLPRGNPGLIEAENPAFTTSRKPLLVEFSFREQRLLLIGNHFVAKTADDPTFGRVQPPTRTSTEQRTAQAEIVAARAHELLQLDPSASVIVLGDLNDSQASTALQPLRSELYPLLNDLPEATRYSYVFEGNAEALDHVFVDEQTRQRVVAFDVAHVHADFARSASDHDPIVVRLAF